MDVGDVDSDGDNDIVIGSLYLPNEILQTKENIKGRPLFLLLRNNTVKKYDQKFLHPLFYTKARNRQAA